MKNILLLILVCLGNMWTLKAQEHPVIYASASDKATILQKIADEEWAKEAFTKIRGNVEKYADRHTADPQWIISRLAMYWKEGERYTQCYLKIRIGIEGKEMHLFLQFVCRVCVLGINIIMFL